ncbi:hypothetical protein AB0B56_05455 [Streptosporangium canum]|uniref:hypothetical protein n=1 Tax=Streptosporangium canum TaxID=324952 RepID=UPI0034249F69
MTKNDSGSVESSSPDAFGVRWHPLLGQEGNEHAGAAQVGADCLGALVGRFQGELPGIGEAVESGAGRDVGRRSAAGLLAGALGGEANTTMLSVSRAVSGMGVSWSGQCESELPAETAIIRAIDCMHRVLIRRDAHISRSERLSIAKATLVN